jgi:glutathione S-transferase
MLKVLGRPTSANVQKVVWFCDEIELPFERTDIGGPFGGNDQPEYLAMNPNGRVPTVIDDGFVIWESNACVHYLASKHAAGTWYPDDLQQRGRCVQWMEWVTSSLAAAHVPVFHGLIRTPADKRDPDAIARGRDNWSKLMAMLDNHLKDNAYIAGDSITIGDIPASVFAFRWFNLDIPREDYPNLKRWHDGIAARPAFKKNIIDIGLK